MRNGVATLASGDRYWYQDGLLHRTDGPAVEYANGEYSWWFEGRLHRVDGPAAEYTNGDRHWFYKGKPLLFDEWLELVDTYTEVEKTLMRLQYA